VRKKQENCGQIALVEALELRQLYSSTLHPATATDSASAQVSLLSTTGSGSSARYTYEITLKDTGSTSLGTFWFGWTPGQDYMKSSPTAISSPTGWTDTITGGGSSDGFAIQWVASSNLVAAGARLSGFKFTSADSPTALAGKSTFFPTTPVETSFVYSGTPFSDSGDQFVAAAPAITTSFLSQLTASPTVSASVVPSNGDNNPYGVAIVPTSFGTGKVLSAGDVLVSNFNDSAGLQGTGSTIVSISPKGKQTTFYKGPKGLGLTTALDVLRSGFVLVGNVPAPNGSTVNGPGSLLVLNSKGKRVTTISNAKLLDGPWDMTVEDDGSSAIAFVSNVLNGTVSRLVLGLNAKTGAVKVESDTEIAKGYAFRTDSAALVVGPTGLAFDNATGNLYVASTGNNDIYSIHAANSRKTPITRGTLIYRDDAHLRGPLALTFAGGNLIAANGDAVNADPNNVENSELVEFTPSGTFANQFQVDPTLGGAFGEAYEKTSTETIFAAVDDVTNKLDEWIIK
jgi:hypothetical protein